MKLLAVIVDADNYPNSLVDANHLAAHLQGSNLMGMHLTIYEVPTYLVDTLIDTWEPAVWAKEIT